MEARTIKDEQKQELFRALVDESPSPMFVSDTQLNLLYGNKAFHALSPTTNQDANLTPLSHLTEGMLGNGNMTTKDEMVFEWNNRSWQALLYQLRLHHDTSKAYLAGQLCDLSRYQEDIRRLEQRAIRAEEASQAKTDCLASLSHEIRTSLGIMLGYADMTLHMGGSQQDMRRFAQTMKTNGQHLLKLLDGMLDIAKVEAGRFEAEGLEISLPEFMTQLENTLTLRAKEKGLVFTLQQHSNLPERVISDPTRLTQILINIAGNAIKFTEAGSVHVAVEALPHSATSVKLRFLITDSGPGLSEMQRQRLFQPFMQADRSTARRFGGTGLGLALSKRLAIALGGDVRLVESALDEGSTFEVTVVTGISPNSPVIAPAERHAREGTQAYSKPYDIAPLSKEPLLQGASILVVDDSEDNQTLFQVLLRAEGADVTLASNGEEAIEAVRKHDFQVVLMDIVMPEQDGCEVTRQLRNLGFSAPIIALSAHVMKTQLDRCLAAGCNDYVTKPVDRDELIRKVSHFIRP